MGLTNNPICVRCLEKDESTTHILRDCETLAYVGFSHLGHYFTETGDYQDAPVSRHYTSFRVQDCWKVNRVGCKIYHWSSRCKGRSRATLMNSFIQGHSLDWKLIRSFIMLKFNFLRHTHTKLKVVLEPLKYKFGHYATRRKVAGSIPDEVIEFFNCVNPSRSTMALGSTKPLKNMSNRNFPGAKGRTTRKTDSLTAICLENMEASTSHKPIGLHDLLQGQFYLFLL
jgi:hypothetical protein